MKATLFQQLIKSTVSRYEELLAYEYLYAQDGMTLRKITSMTVGMGLTPSQVMEDQAGLLDPKATDLYRDIENYLSGRIGSFDLAINGTASWPEKLADSSRPAPVLYYQGSISLVDRKSVSVVGSRKATREGMRLAETISEQLSERGYVIVTGLARGIDASASSMSLRYRVGSIGVIGTPIGDVYPKENEPIFEGILENEGLIISQVPFYRYHVQPFKTKRFYFPERNELMAAISSATVIVEASDTSGTLSQARACAYQNRPLFITRHALSSQGATWPTKWAGRRNVHIVDDGNDIADFLDSHLAVQSR